MKKFIILVVEILAAIFIAYLMLSYYFAWDAAILPFVSNAPVSQNTRNMIEPLLGLFEIVVLILIYKTIKSVGKGI